MTEENKQPRPLTPEEQEDLNRRVKEFNEKFVYLLGKYKLALGAIAYLTPDGRVRCEPKIFNDSKRDQKVDGGEKPKGNLETAE